MRVRDNGCFYTVSVSPIEIRAFKSKWPCSRIPSSKTISFQFDKKNGDLVDIWPTRYDGDDLAALSQDAQTYGQKKLNQMNNNSEIKQILNDPCASFWLKQSLQNLLNRDIVDATHDAQKLADVMQRRCDDVLAGRI